ncbi:MAG TPA: glycoside hydrolase family 27 protein [Dyella sp.]|uniref:glycoside hydrolase family 27 protein n=1 Tax=Dyella sp. TaxID=1869338 RepID=UPI002C39F3FB|nr:glycoside hydrolase family 27 protein [Dyella sp.]HUB88807.1 glycoside hydrolase family 27 protein [Dyella sp.]
MRFPCVAVAVLALLVTSVRAETPVAKTPPMGWNSWNFFAEKVTDADVREAADAMVSSGMRDAGYIYVNIDDGWQGERDAKGVIHPNARFPNMKALADYVHARGLKLGIYSSPGPKTCAGYTGSLGHEQQDAQTYAAWGVDYLKYDLCSYLDVMKEKAPNDAQAQMRLMEGAYETMRTALNATHRPIVYSLCQYGMDAVWEWAAAPRVGGNLWRTTGDISADWDRIYTLASMQAGLAAYAGPGHWNDPDMLEVGNGQLTAAENRAHFSWWAMLAAPLLAGNDLPHMSPAVRDILTRREVIAIDQDPLGKQATRAYADGETEVWTRPLQGGALAVAVFNVGGTRYAGTHPFHLDLARLGLHGTQQGEDVWTGKAVTLHEREPIALHTHDVWLLRIPVPRR